MKSDSFSAIVFENYWVQITLYYVQLPPTTKQNLNLATEVKKSIFLSFHK